MTEPTSQQQTQQPQPQTEQLHFSPHFSTSNFKLFQLPDDLLHEIESGLVTDLYIKAPNDPNQPVILCTNNRTFTVVSIDTSNTVLLRQTTSKSSNDNDSVGGGGSGSGSGSDRQVSSVIQGSVNCVYEVTEKPSNTMYATLEYQIRRLLSQSPFYSGMDYEDDGMSDEDDDEADNYSDMDDDDEPMTGSNKSRNSKNSNNGIIKKTVKKNVFLTTEDLEKRLLASRLEIYQVLSSMPVIQVKQYWRLIDPVKYDEYCSLFFLTVQAEGWKLDSIPAEHCLRLLKEEGHDSLLAHHCILAFRDKSAGGGGASQHDAGDGATIGLDIKKITIHYGRSLLEQKSRWLRDDFTSELQARMSDICSLIKSNGAPPSTNSSASSSAVAMSSKPQVSHLLKSGIAREEVNPTDHKVYIRKC